MSGDAIDPKQWIALVGIPKINELERDVSGLKQALWIACGGGVTAGSILTVFLPKVLHLMGLT